MRKFLILALATCLIACGCTPKTVISKTYDFNQMDRIGVMAFTNARPALQGVENLFAKYLISAGFKVVENIIFRCPAICRPKLRAR